jgi:SAM-dependent methyltransferase
MTSEHELFDTFTSEDWWDPKGKQAALHSINPLRFEYFAGKLGDIKGKRVLDVGCGGGLLSESFTSAGALVIGIDLSEAAIKVAKEHAKESGLKIDYRATSLSKLVQEGTEPFDSVVLSEVLEHTDDLKGLVRDAHHKQDPHGPVSRHIHSRRRPRHDTPRDTRIQKVHKALTAHGPSQGKQYINGRDKGNDLRPLAVKIQVVIQYIGKLPGLRCEGGSWTLSWGHGRLFFTVGIRVKHKTHLIAKRPGFIYYKNIKKQPRKKNTGQKKDTPLKKLALK